MKISLFIVDYHHKNSSGLSTYVNQLVCFLKHSKEIDLNLIGVKANIDSIVEKQLIEGTTHYLYARELNIIDENNKVLIDFLRNEIQTSSPIIFHFNWINHAPFAQVLKRNFNCITILTKHCIPWRDNITNNYKLFKLLNRKLLSKSNSFPYHSSLHREFIAYSSVDHIIAVSDFAGNSLIKMFEISEEKISRVYNGINFYKEGVNGK